MRDDLLDAQAAVDWAVAQIPALEAKIGSWRKAAYSVRIQPDPQNGKKAYYVSLNPIPSDIRVEVGNILHSIRSGLDLLAVALAERNGHAAPRDVYFPICASEAAFLDTGRGGGKKKIKRLSATDQAVFEGLKPYHGGNDLLYALHHLDITKSIDACLRLECFLAALGLTRLMVAASVELMRRSSIERGRALKIPPR